MDCPDYRYSPNYHCMYTFNPGTNPAYAATPTLSQYVSVSGQISPRRTNLEETPTDHRLYTDGSTVEMKVINPDKRSDIRLYMLRNVDCDELSSPADINRIVFEQLGQNIVSKDLTFDVGYYKGTKRVTILSADDMRDVKRLLRSTGSKVTLWCMGLSTKQASVGKRTRDKPNSDSEISDSDDEPRRAKTKRKSTKRSKHEEQQELELTIL